jgi:hypothetical protein
MEETFMVFRRPELEKDNPIASQPYVGPRRRRIQAHAVLSEESTGLGEMKETLQALTDAAACLVNSLPKSRKADKGLTVLRNAIAQAEQLLSADGRSA